ncbi:DUF3419 family protein [Alkaliphilus pronyensis]|uniref:DUF3419 family protein n=1 Tax=Alkaliphilus pronyensis TaxID=1482732 RepID=A0A6I0EXB8_9FIRM|nr:DUF3419 family protein [Alkaliphilus pronyensis]KAB3533474.1 DUF3419 family protein [Alkaliphilus pronyensis]
MAVIEGFKNVLNYSTCNEDSLTEIKALDISKSDNVLCITGSGGRVLNLLTQAPQKIVAIDFNPIQNWLLELKIAAIKNLSYYDYRRFIGLDSCSERKEIFYSLRNDLSKDSYSYWEKNIRIVSRGVIYQGHFEKKCKFFSDLLKEAMGDKVDKILSFDDLDAQKEFYKKQWDNSLWQNNINFSVTKAIDPAFYLYVNEEYNFAEYLFNILDKGLKRHLAKENHFLCLLLDGSYSRATKLPLYLQRESFQLMKSNLWRVEIITENVVNYLKGCGENYFNKFSLSDVTGYLSDDNSNSLYKYLINSAADNSRLCGRSLLAKREIPLEYSKNIKRDNEIEEQLEKLDLTIAYKVLVADISM